MKTPSLLRLLNSHPQLDFSVSVKAPQFNTLGIRGPSRFVSCTINLLFQLQQGNERWPAHLVAPGYQLLVELSQGRYRDNKGFTVVIEPGAFSSASTEGALKTKTPTGRFFGPTKICLNLESINTRDGQLHPIIQLGHELVHAWRAQTGIAINRPQWDNFGPEISKLAAQYDELETVGGLIPLTNGGIQALRFSENHLRDYLNMPSRQTYRGENFAELQQQIPAAISGEQRQQGLNEATVMGLLMMYACAQIIATQSP